MQCDNPAYNAMEPTGQSGQVMVRFPYFPAGHSNTEVAFGQYDPFGHKVHSIEPRSLAVDPAWQSSQALEVVWPVLFPNFPAGHSNTEVAFGQYDPFGHRVHSVDPRSIAIDPDWQSSQVVCPVRFPYVPTGHSVFTPPGQADPFGHRVQLRESTDPR